MLISNALLVVNGKGGVGKTSVAANLAAGAAATGWRVLAVDLDSQGNLARDLGYLDRSDGGASLRHAVIGTGPVNVVKGVRNRLDVIAGGPEVGHLADDLARIAATSGPGSFDALGLQLAPLSGAYELLVIDMPPGNSAMQRAAASFARFVLCPTTTDDAGIDGIGRVFDTLRDVPNEQLEVLGVVLTLATASATSVVRRAREELRSLLGVSVPVFDATIRHALAAAVACRSQGVTAAEYAAQAAASKPWYAAHAAGEVPERFSSAAQSLAADYEDLVGEVLTAIRLSVHENAQELSA